MSSGTGPISFQAEVALERGNDFAEGPVWDAERGALLWVDMFAGAVEAWDPVSGAHERNEYGRRVSAVAPRAAGGQVLAAGHDLLALDEEGEVTELLATVAAEVESESHRFNDCRCDPQGRLWCGTMPPHKAPGRGALYRVGPDLRPQAQVERTRISNGIGWDPAGEWMYFIDSATQRLDAFEFDGADGSLGDRRAIAAIPAEAGLPDGLAVDAEGGVWVALFRGAAVHRYTPDGELDAIVRLPVRNVTCPAFGGPGLGTLFVTTGRYSASATEAEDRRPAGALFAVDVGVAGLPATPFAG